MRKTKDKKIENKDKKLFEKYKKIVDVINKEDELFEESIAKDDILDNLFIKADDLVYNLEQAWDVKPDMLTEKEKHVLVNLIKSSKRLRGKIMRIIQDLKYDDQNIGRA